MKIKDIVIIGMMAAILVTVQVALAFVPNIELVSLLIILYTLVFGWRTLYIIYVFAVVEIFIYGLGEWNIYYLYVWSILFFIVLLFRKSKSTYFFAVISGFFGLSFGALCSLSYIFMYGFRSALGFFVSGIIFDLIHCIGNFVTAVILFKPLYSLLSWINRKLEMN